MNEIWRDIQGYEGIYMVSNQGNVLSVNFGSMHSGKPKVMKLSKSSSGYLHVQLYKNGVAKTLLVHTLVANAFIPNPDCLPEVNHKDGDKTNNTVSNLEWVTKSQNTIHAIKNNFRPVNHSLGKKGKDCKTSKPVEQYNLDGSFIRLWDSREDAAASLGVRRSSICDCANGRKKTCCGYVWKNPVKN